MPKDKKCPSDSIKSKGQTKNPSPKRLTPSIKKDVIHPTDYSKYQVLSSCEDCSHFDAIKEICTLGYESKHHRKSQQEKAYLLSGKIAFCRFHEID